MARCRDLPDLLLQHSHPSQCSPDTEARVSQADAALRDAEARGYADQNPTHADPGLHILFLRGERIFSPSRDGESLQLSQSMAWIESSGLFHHLQRSALCFSAGSDPLSAAAFEKYSLASYKISGLPIIADFSMRFIYSMPIGPKGHSLGLLALDLPYSVQRRLPNFCMDAMAAVPDVQIVPAPYYEVRVPGGMQVTISPPADM